MDEGLHEKNFGQYIFVPVSDSHPHVLGDAYRIDRKKNLKKKISLNACTILSKNHKAERKSGMKNGNISFPSMD